MLFISTYQPQLWVYRYPFYILESSQLKNLKKMIFFHPFPQVCSFRFLMKENNLPKSRITGIAKL
ncbi:MAG TPA: hypothetical protein DCE41_05015 [Cytophagales bacterium]|nr:hypothetical protein [Cytophagales bacterium]